MLLTLIDGTEVEQPDVVQRYIEHAHRLTDSDEGRIVGPDSTIDKSLPAHCRGRKIGRRGSRRECYVHDRGPPVTA